MEQYHFAMLSVDVFLKIQNQSQEIERIDIGDIPAILVNPHQVQSHTPRQSEFHHQGVQLYARSRWTAGVRPVGLVDENRFLYAQARSHVADPWETAELDVFLEFRNLGLRGLDTGLEDACKGVDYNELGHAFVLAPWPTMVPSYLRVC